MTMRHPNQMREEILGMLQAPLERLRVRVSMYWPDEEVVLRALERPTPDAPDGQLLDVLVDATNFLMARLGHKAVAPSDPRFDKTRRVLAKIVPKGPRGEVGQGAARVVRARRAVNARVKRAPKAEAAESG